METQSEAINKKIKALDEQNYTGAPRVDLTAEELEELNVFNRPKLPELQQWGKGTRGSKRKSVR